LTEEDGNINQRLQASADLLTRCIRRTNVEISERQEQIKRCPLTLSYATHYTLLQAELAQALADVGMLTAWRADLLTGGTELRVDGASADAP
jgi:hypothetical protein